MLGMNIIAKFKSISGVLSVGCLFPKLFSVVAKKIPELND